MAGQNEMLCWKQYVQKETRLRLQWFLKNEDRLNEIVLTPNAHHVSEEDKEAVAHLRQKLNHGTPRYPKSSPEEVAVEDDFVQKTMKPIPQEITDIIYKSNRDGRVRYLHERNKVLPEDRYYCKETSNFKYGWKMWDCAKTMDGSKFGKSAIIKQSFYRRRSGIEEDPSWYRNPPRTSPTVCNNSS